MKDEETQAKNFATTNSRLGEKIQIIFSKVGSAEAKNHCLAWTIQKRFKIYSIVSKTVLNFKF